MKLTFDIKLTAKYESQSQKARVLTEHWVDNSVFCPNCGHLNLDKYGNNKPVADFYCRVCCEDYELKSQQKTLGMKIVDGAYKTMLERLESSHNPNLFLLNYDLTHLKVTNLFVIPKYYFVPGLIEKRKPLSPKARRAGWVGCNILLSKVPQSGKIYFVRDSRIEPKGKVLREWKKTLFLKEEKEVSTKGWLIDIMRCVEKFSNCEFTLGDVYQFENELHILHPGNKHIRDKIRQQLQILRDKGYLKFIARGRYKARE